MDVDTVEGDRRFVRVVPGDSAALVDALAARVRTAYFDAKAALARLREAAAELTQFDGSHLIVTEAEVEEALEDELDAVLPAEWKKGGRPAQTATQRSELAEIIATEVVTSLFSTVVPASRIASKEIPDQQTRGVDVLGLEHIGEPNLTLVVGEVKGSCESASPPGVIADMEKKLIAVSTDRRQLLQELIWLRDHSDDANARTCMILCSGYLLRKLTPELVLTPILIRTSVSEGVNDYGRFRKSRAIFDFPIRFICVIVEAQDLFDLAVAVYRKARELTAS
jgi:hypothetical protein